MAKTYPMESVVLHPKLQCRASVSQDVIEEYGRLIKEGVKFPPLRCVSVKGDILLTDGFARYMAHEAIGKTKVQCEVREGSMEDAIREACNANATHGVRRSTQDKINAVMLAHATWPDLSNREIAEVCGLSRDFVNKHRPKPAAEPTVEKPVAAKTRVASDVSVSKTPAKVGGSPIASTAQTKVADCSECFNNEMILTDHGWCCSLCMHPEVQKGDLEDEPAVGDASFDVVEIDKDEFKEFLSHLGRAVRSAKRAGLLSYINADLDALKAKAIKIAEGK